MPCQDLHSFLSIYISSVYHPELYFTQPYFLFLYQLLAFMVSKTGLDYLYFFQACVKASPYWISNVIWVFILKPDLGDAVKMLILYLQRGFLIVTADNNHILSIIDRMICDPFIMIHIPQKLDQHFVSRLSNKYREMKSFWA